MKQLLGLLAGRPKNLKPLDVEEPIALWIHGQLARTRRSSAPFDRILDGIADLVVSVSVVLGSAWIVWGKATRSAFNELRELDAVS